MPVFDVLLLVVVPLFVVGRVFIVLLFIVPPPPPLLLMFVVEPVLVVPPDIVFIAPLFDIEFVLRIILPFALLLLSADEQLPLIKASVKSDAKVKVVFIENFSCFVNKCWFCISKCTLYSIDRSEKVLSAGLHFERFSKK